MNLQKRSCSIEKTEMIDRFLQQMAGDFSISDIVKSCPGISVDMIRRTLKDRKAAGKMECQGSIFINKIYSARKRSYVFIGPNGIYGFFLMSNF